MDDAAVDKDAKSLRRAEAAVLKARQTLEKQSAALGAARDKLKSALARPAGAAAKRARDSAESRVARLRASTREARRNVSKAELALRNEHIRQRIASAEKAVQLKILERERTLSDKAELDFQAARAQFEKRWRKKRLAEDKAKLEEIRRNLKAKHRQAVRVMKARLKAEPATDAAPRRKPGRPKSA